MPLWLRVARTWIPLAVVTTALVGFTYLGVQQSYRSGLNDPQVQLAEDGAARLDEGATPASVAGTGSVDIARSLAPFVIVYDAANAPLASSGHLDGSAPRPPAGVLDAARAAGSDTVTWQPRQGVRIASVSVATKDGRVVLAGRNMREVEARVDNLTAMAGLAWAAAFVGALVTCAVVEVVAGRVNRAAS